MAGAYHGHAPDEHSSETGKISRQNSAFVVFDLIGEDAFFSEARHKGNLKALRDVEETFKKNRDSVREELEETRKE